MLQIIKYEVFKPEGEDGFEFVKRIEDNLDMFVHCIGSDVSITVTYDPTTEKLNVKTLRLYEHTN